MFFIRVKICKSLNITHIYSGGGSYDDIGDQIKTGTWTELSYNFLASEITYKGQYYFG